MNAIITVVGSDKVGIIAKVSGFLAEHKVADAMGVEINIMSEKVFSAMHRI